MRLAPICIAIALILAWPPAARALEAGDPAARAVLADLADDEAWGDLGDALARAGEEELAQGCYTLARLLDWEDPEWRHKARLESPGRVIQALGIISDEWVGEVADLARGQARAELALELYQLALQLDPDDPEWRRRVEEAGAVPGAGTTADITPEITALREKLRQGPDSDGNWGLLGERLAAAGDPALAGQCYAVARLLDWDEPRWQELAPRPEQPAAAVAFVGLEDDEWVGNLGDRAAGHQLGEAAQGLYRLARRLDPQDPEWRTKARDDAAAPVTTTAEITPAITGLRESLAQNPANDESWGDLGDALAAGGDRDLAGGCYAVARLLDWNDPEWRRKVQWRGAARAIEFAGVTSDEWVGDLGDTANQRQQPATAQELFQLAHRLDPADPEWRHKSRAAGGAGSVALNAPDVVRCRQRVAQNPPNDEAWGDLGDALQAAGDANLAQGCYTVARILDWGDSEWRTKAQMRNAVQAIQMVGITNDEWIGDLGDLAVNRGATAVARELFQLALQLDPGDSEWRRKTQPGYVASGGGPRQPPGVGLPPQAMSFTMRLQQTPRNDEIWGDLGDTLRASGQPELAHGCYVIARLQDWGDGEWVNKCQAWRNAARVIEMVGISDDEWVGDVGDLAVAHGQQEIARELFQLALQLDPGDSEWRRKVRDTGGVVRGGANAGTLRSQVAVNPQDGDGWGTLGYVLARDGEAELALGCFCVASLLDGEDEEWRRLAQWRNVRQAVEEIGVQNADWVGQLAQAALERGRPVVARELYELAARQAPNNQEWPARVRELADK